MRATNMKNTTTKTQLLVALTMALSLWLSPAAYAAAPGITGPTFNLTAIDAIHRPGDCGVGLSRHGRSKLQRRSRHQLRACGTQG
jgi:hypothetical protein